MAERRVVITGLGAVTPLGLDLQTTWQNLTAGKSGVAEIQGFDASDQTSRIAGEVRGFDPESIVPKKNLRRYDRYSLLALAASAEAWSDAGLEVETPYERPRMGCILGVGMGGLQTLEDNHSALREGGPRKVRRFLFRE